VNVTQAGRIRVEKLTISLVWEETATFLQGTDVRSEACRVVPVSLAGKPSLAYPVDRRMLDDTLVAQGETQVSEF
jgi:hypothetical protein